MTLVSRNQAGAPTRSSRRWGAGGMGEVYRAKDPRLGREVAVKVLPASFSQDPDRLKRFEAEARAAGVLNHPGITAVYDFGTARGSVALHRERELLGGRDAAQLDSLSGSLPVRKAIDYAVQIAQGSGGGAREGDRAPGPEAREPLPDEGRAGQDPGLRSGEAQEREGRELSTRTSRRCTEVRSPAWFSGRWATCLPSRSAASPRTSDPISSPSARSSTRCWRASGRFAATPPRTRSRRF